ncbi:hypothetical protein GCM10025858_01520 [Alicyclobacillus sacchari]|nr:hypothetical protein GCM10025858_01520 [Alicyclobacillus sacchari]
MDEEMLTHGIAFDGSSIQGFRGIEDSDMVMRPVLETAFVDPFMAVPTLAVSCSVFEPNGTRFERDPRYIAEKAEAYLASSGIATTAYFGPELEFFIFDDVRFESTNRGAFYAVDSEEAMWNTGNGEKNLGYQVKNKGGYFPVPPIDTQQDIRTEMVKELMNAGIRVERHHHEVATAGQAEINFRFNTLTRTADTVMTYKYIIRNVARKYGKTVTFMPKPVFGDNGSGMHVHQSLFDGDTPLFFEQDRYGNMSDIALHYIAAFCITRLQFWPFQTQARILTSAWSRVMKRLSIWSSQKATAALPFVYRLRWSRRRPHASSSAHRTARPTRISRLQPC